MKPLLIVVFAAGMGLAGAQLVPSLFNYQGHLANADGTPFPTSDYELRFSIYDAPTNEIPVWGPQVFDGAPDTGHGPRLPVVQGYFNVMLGPVDTRGRSILSAFSSSNRFVEVTVSNRPAVLPRQQILTTPYAAQAGNGSPPGSVTAYFGTILPSGWLWCDGKEVSRDDYRELYRVIGDSSGAGNGVSTFRLPDLRGMFLRGVTGARNDGWQDPADGRLSPQSGGAYAGIGSYQSDSFRSHRHPAYEAGAAGVIKSVNETLLSGRPGAPWSTGQVTENSMTLNEGGPETRPRNVGVNYIIKYGSSPKEVGEF